MQKKLLWLFFYFFWVGKGTACKDTYRVRLSNILEKSYEILETPGGEQIVYIDFRDDKEAILAIVEGLQNCLPEALDFIVILGDKANILGAFIAQNAGVPWVVLNNKKTIKTIFQSISYKSTTSGAKVLYLNTDQAKKIRGKRIVLLDDILSSGETISAAVRLVKAVDAEILGILVGFTEGEDRSVLVVDEKAYPIFKVGHLPVFPKGGSEDIP